eukprot:2312630-Pyramimonas_sp.AAC.3
MAVKPGPLARDLADRVTGRRCSWLTQHSDTERPCPLRERLLACRAGGGGAQCALYGQPCET